MNTVSFDLDIYNYSAIHEAAEAFKPYLTVMMQEEGQQIICSFICSDNQPEEVVKLFMNYVLECTVHREHYR